MELVKEVLIINCEQHFTKNKTNEQIEDGVFICKPSQGDVTHKSTSLKFGAKNRLEKLNV